ncbi:lanthionine synthetase-like protein [Brevibacillus sp. AG162]|uniref:lanthionine synthetase C family protein n=1 Tax=Brevibacillus sp. AG162 TaxID=2572910 RepID=UPI00115474E2|nr:lanthionine synthetase C family protein [Brevibacillus sp. AG162]TQK75175.1 lanthionine synthetase-like protein [Brevibacillus sp. AG162]
MLSNTKNWQPIKNDKLIKNIEYVVKQVARKLQSPHTVLGEPISGTESLASGALGIVLFYAELDRLYPEEQWDVVAHNYLVYVQTAINANTFQSLSLWSGLSGAPVVASILARNRGRYQNFIEKLHILMQPAIDEFINQARGRIGSSLFMPDYDVIEGLAGIGRYLLSFKEHPKCKENLNKVLAYTVQLTKDIQVNGRNVPGWHIKSENQFLEHEQKRYPHGNFNLGISHGIAGPFALLSLALLEGVKVAGQREAIRKLCSYYGKWKAEDEHGPIWPERISFEEETCGQVQNNFAYNASWCYGEPSIARVLWLAGEALGDIVIKSLAQEVYLSLVQRSVELASPTFCHGDAGTLWMLQRMMMDTDSDVFEAYREKLVNKILNSYNENNAYGFQDIEQGQSQDVPGLLVGAAGVALVLLSCLSLDEPEWDCIFLLK